MNHREITADWVADFFSLFSRKHSASDEETHVCCIQRSAEVLRGTVLNGASHQVADNALPYVFSAYLHSVLPFI